MQENSIRQQGNFRNNDKIYESPFFLQSVTLQLFRTFNLNGPLWVIALQVFGLVPLLTLFVHCFPNQSHKVFQEMQGHLFLKFLLMATSLGWGVGGGGGVRMGILGGVCYLVLQIRFQTEKCNFPHPFSDENYKIHTHFQTWS